MSHSYHPRRVPIEETERQLASEEPLLFDGCEDCDAKAREPLLLSRKLAEALWCKMVNVDFLQEGLYRSNNEAVAGSKLYSVALFCQRHFGLEPSHDGLEGTSQLG